MQTILPLKLILFPPILVSKGIVFSKEYDLFYTGLIDQNGLPFSSKL